MPRKTGFCILEAPEQNRRQLDVVVSDCTELYLCPGKEHSLLLELSDEPFHQSVQRKMVQPLRFSLMRASAYQELEGAG